MPGPVSDSYDPEFGCGENATAVKNAIENMHGKLGVIIGSHPLYIVDVVQNPGADSTEVTSAQLTIQEWRILRFACERACESI